MRISATGLESKTEIETIKTIYDKELGQLSFLKVYLHTGRMHQIRIHLASEGFPIIGDLIYGNPAINRKFHSRYKITRQLLHCWRYHFQDMNEKTRDFIAPLPEEFGSIGRKTQ